MDTIKIRMTKNIITEYVSSMDAASILRSGYDYEAVGDLSGAVYGICKNGELISLLPDEFEFLGAPSWLQDIWAEIGCIEKVMDRLLELMWDELTDVPVDEADTSSNPILADNWWRFSKGTDRDDIWHFFDERHSKGVYYLLYGYSDYNNTDKESNILRANVREANEINGVNAGHLKQMRINAHQTLHTCAEILGISITELNDYEIERKPLPLEYSEKLNFHLLSVHFIEPSEDKYGHVRTLKFIGHKDGSTEDLYRIKENSARLIRQKRDDTIVLWTTVCGSEADCPVKDGMTLNVVDSAGKLIFSETTYRTLWNGSGLADKVYPFSWEQRD